MKKINILIASDSYKGSLSSMDVANSMEKGFLKADKNVEIHKIPIADGGEGTVEAVTNALNGELKAFEVMDVFGNKTSASLGVLDKDRIIIETASPLGLDKISKENLDPMKATSYGLGEMILNALDLEPKEIYIGLGGSAVNDGGAGLASALGAKFIDNNGNLIKKGAIGLKDLHDIEIDNLDSRLEKTKFYLLSDVTNPLCGENGATYVYGPQKGVKDSELEELDQWMKNYGKILEDKFEKSIIDTKGSGAAGGLGGCLLAFTNANLTSGIEKILEMIKIDELMKDSDIVFTGEGKMDGQSIYGKAPIGVAKLAKKYDLPVIAIVGSSDESSAEVYDHGIDLILDIINEPMDLSEAIKNAEVLIENQAEMALKHYAKLIN